MSLLVDIEKRVGNFHLRARFEGVNGVTGLLGPSGCGKSMTLKCIAGIERPDRGRIELNGRVLFDAERRIDLKPQELNEAILRQFEIRFLSRLHSLEKRNLFIDVLELP